MKNFYKEVPLGGIVEIHIPSAISQWSNRNYISQWGEEEFRIYEDIWRGGKRLRRTLFKLTISKDQATILILKLNLRNEQGFFKSGSMWRTTYSEKEYVLIEQQAWEFKKLLKK